MLEIQATRAHKMLEELSRSDSIYGEKTVDILGLKKGLGLKRRLYSFPWILTWPAEFLQHFVTVVCLVALDAIFVFSELLLDLSIIEGDKEKIVSQVFHYLSIVILTIFILELAGKLYAFRLEFFWHKFEILDGVVVIVSFVLDIVYIAQEDAFDGLGLLILLRLWRVGRIINGVLLAMKSQLKKKEIELKRANNNLSQKVDELQSQCTELTQEVDRLRRLLQENKINYQINEETSLEVY